MLLRWSIKGWSFIKEKRKTKRRITVKEEQERKFNKLKQTQVSDNWSVCRSYMGNIQILWGRQTEDLTDWDWVWSHSKTRYCHMPLSSSKPIFTIQNGNESHFPTSVFIQSLILFQIAHAHILSDTTMWRTAHFSNRSIKAGIVSLLHAQMGEHSLWMLHTAWRAQWNKDEEMWSIEGM